MFRTLLGQFTVRRRRLVLALTVLFLVAAGMVGTGVFGSLAGGGFDDPGSESSQASEYLSDELGATDPELVLLVHTTDGDVDDPATAATGAELTASDCRGSAGGQRRLLLVGRPAPGPPRHRWRVGAS